MPDARLTAEAADRVRTQLHRAQSMRRLEAAAWSLVAGCAAASLAALAASAGGLSSGAQRALAVAAMVLVTLGTASRAWRMWTRGAVAAEIERGTPRFDNLLVTADEALSGRLTLRNGELERTLLAVAAERLERAPAVAARPDGVMALTVAVLAATATLVLSLPAEPSSAASGLDAPSDAVTGVDGDVRVVVSPPPYTGLPTVRTVNPESVTVVEGSRVRLETARGDRPVVLSDSMTAADVVFKPEGASLVLELVAVESRPLLVRFGPVGGSGDAGATTARSRLVSLRVQPDLRPVVRIRTPGKDLLLGDASGRVRVEVDARDDLALSSLTLRYTRVSGSGESFTFGQGDVPLTVDRATGDQWTASATLGLDALQLADGDTLIYQAVARDAKPGADPGLSESYVIEIGRLPGVSSTGFALPDDRERQGLSQQMLILKTEKLHATRGSLSADAALEQSRLLAIEQRMVRAEFVFMTGGEVQDEVEEATHAHDLAEGRLENQGQAELLAAIREMSRAEARLNAGDTAQALVFERAALAALQRAFDRRRYLLRTLPERTRIDLDRRLSGDLSAVRPAPLPVSDPATDLAAGRAREVLQTLSQLGGEMPRDPGALAARVLSVDPVSEALQRSAAAIADHSDRSAWPNVRRDAERALAGFIMGRVDPAAGARLTRDPLAGWWADERRRRVEP